MDDPSAQQPEPTPDRDGDGVDRAAAAGAAERAAVAELERILLERGPLTVVDLAAALREQSPAVAAALLDGRPDADLPEHVTRLARHADEFWGLSGGRVAPVLHLLRRATFTHRLTAREVARGVIDICPDLLALALPRAGTPSAGPWGVVGPEDDDRAADDGSLAGPDGALDGFAAGDLLAVTYDGVDVRVGPAATAGGDGDGTGAEAAAVGAALRSAYDDLPADPAPDVHRLVIDAIGERPASFARQVPPVGELLAGVGLRARGPWAGPADGPWATPAEQARRRRLGELVAGADQCCERAARRALEAWHAWLVAVERTGATTGPDAAPTPAGAGVDAAAAEDVDHGPVAAMLAEVATVGRPRLSSRRLGQWATALATTGPARPGLEYLRALGADTAGDATAAEAHLQAGLAVAPDHPACLAFLAELIEDRGDAQQALSLLRRAGRPPQPEALRELEPFLAGRDVGRNDPCPCGSGRKFKACCAGRTVRAPLVARARWLLSKSARYAIRTDPGAVRSLRQLFEITGNSGETLALVGDMLLFPGGGLARYLGARGALLPDDEAAVAEAWTGQPMRLLEIHGPVAVNGTGSASTTAAIDARSGEQLRLDDPAAAALAAGTTVLTRALPVGDVWLLSSALVRVPASVRDRALAMLDTEVRPFGLLELLVDLQVAGLKG